MIAEALAPWVERHGWNPGADAFARLDVLLGLWRGYGAALNLHGAKTDAALVRHVQDGLETALCAAAVVQVDAQTQWLDVGSGGGFPSLVVSAVLPCTMTAVEPRERRAAFLEMAFAAIERGSSRVIRTRTDDATWNEKVFSGLNRGYRGQFDVASARAVFGPAQWMETGRAMIARPGFLLVHGESGVPPTHHVTGTFGSIEIHRFT